MILKTLEKKYSARLKRAKVLFSLLNESVFNDKYFEKIGKAELERVKRMTKAQIINEFVDEEELIIRAIGRTLTKRKK